MSFNYLREKKTTSGVNQFHSGVGTRGCQVNEAVFLRPLK